MWAGIWSLPKQNHLLWPQNCPVHPPAKQSHTNPVPKTLQFPFLQSTGTPLGLHALVGACFIPEPADEDEPEPADGDEDDPYPGRYIVRWYMLEDMTNT